MSDGLPVICKSVYARFIGYMRHMELPWKLISKNSIVKLDEEGYPSMFYYRDNQGYYFMESKAAALKELVGNLNEKE
ncbi:hypothetical protein GCM10020331_090160 [Ectobacillus funiculus]